MDKLFYLLLVLVGGVASAIQSPINAALGKRIGVFEGGLVSFIVGTIVMAALVLIFGKGDLLSALHGAKWQLLGGVFGVIMVMMIIIATPKLGVSLVLAGVVLGQLAASMVIDHFGLFQTQVVPINMYRIIGILLIIAGVFFVYKSKVSA
ncbi:MAG: DMT family transporter [Bacillota bacterium]|nr:DMT family transporter [Bacillota bacterium]